MQTNKIKKIIEIFKSYYGDVKPELIYSSAFELLIATILSAQCTDKRVNIVTKELFVKYKKPIDYINVSTEEIENDIFSTGFYKQKAKSIKSVCKSLIDEYNGEVPGDFDKLLNLPGVGRKTAAVIAGNWFNIPAIAVDTHVKRITNIMGIVSTDNPEKIEYELKNIIPQNNWIDISLLFSEHGRKICIARKPKCEQCPVNEYCASYKILSEPKT